MTGEQYMRRAIELARKGEGWCHPNPLVGAVIVKDDRIIGEGYHAKFGDLHAERNAIAHLTESAEGATLFCTLEPCCHYGKQPPCTTAIIENRIAKVVIGSRDPNPLVHGKGAAILREAGIEVVEDFLREECDALNPIFFHYITSQTPYFIMKYAMTMDGKIATRTGASQWITGEAARGRVQQMRHACMGIMAGIGTVLADDPLLNCRIENGRSPVRILCDSHLRLPLDSQLVQTAGEYTTIDACAVPQLPEGEITQETLQEFTAQMEKNLDLHRLSAKAEKLLRAGIQIWNLPRKEGEGIDLVELRSRLGQRGIDSVLLEGGATLNESALEAGIVSRVEVFVAPKIFGGGGKSPVEGLGVAVPDEAYPFRLVKTEQIGEDLLLTYLPREAVKMQKRDS